MAHGYLAVSLHAAAASLFSTPKCSPAPLFYSISCWQLLLACHCYLTVCWSGWRLGQHQLVWEDEKTRWLLVFQVFSPCRHARRDFVLLYENWTEYDPTCCANNTPSRVSFVPGSHNKHKDTLQFGAQDSSHVPVWCPGHLLNSASPPCQKPEFLLPPPLFLLLSFPFFHGLVLPEKTVE